MIIINGKGECICGGEVWINFDHGQGHCMNCDSLYRYTGLKWIESGSFADIDMELDGSELVVKNRGHKIEFIIRKKFR